MDRAKGIVVGRGVIQYDGIASLDYETGLPWSHDHAHPGTQ